MKKIFPNRTESDTVIALLKKQQNKQMDRGRQDDMENGVSFVKSLVKPNQQPR